MKYRPAFISSLALILVAALTYLPLINQLGYTHDDWYLMASVRAEGPGVFREIFSVDRPLRALVMIPAYKLFGENALSYNLSAYIFRVLGALALLWILRMLWPRQHIATLLMALLFLVYPGFLSQTNGIDYQSHIVGLAAALCSVALTLQALFTENRLSKSMLHFFSILLGLLYLGQMEWYIGIEFFRWACVFVYISRSADTLLQKIRRTIQRAYPALAIPLVFLTWRILFFEGERSATDIGVQFEDVKLYPLQTLYHWGVQVLQDLLDVFLLAWATPLSQLSAYIQIWGVLLALITTGLVIFIIHKDAIVETEPVQPNEYREVLVLGLLTAIAGLIPIAMVNREVSFPAYSRYSLIASIGVAILIIALLMNLKRNFLRNGIFAVLLITAMLVQHGNTIKQVRETNATNMFWWQVAWRVPQFEKNTTLVANYPAVLEEDYFVWGPASLIYYPEKQNPKNIQPGLFAAILNAETITKIQARERQEYDSRKHIITYKNYRNFVLLNQPSAASCVHIMDGNSPAYSHSDSESIQTIAPYSEIEHVLADETPHTPPVIVFGPEPAHGWCYYYQKADLARQQGNWNKVLEIGQRAFNQGLSPNDPIEWMPFLQAYAQTGNIDRLKELAPAINADPFIAQQVCHILGSAFETTPQVFEAIDSLYCTQ